MHKLFLLYYQKLIPDRAIICHSRCQINYNILLETNWSALFNASLIVGIYSVVPKIIANKTCSY